MPLTDREERYRQTAHGELKRIVQPFRTNDRLVSSGDLVSIAALDGSGTFLDGNVYSAGVNLMPSRLAPYTGTRWQIQLHQSGGTWSFLNQGQDEQKLAGSGNAVSLGRAPVAASLASFDTTRWLIYQDLTGFRLRPCMNQGGWLAVKDGAAVLMAPDQPVGRWAYWSIMPYAAGE